MTALLPVVVLAAAFSFAEDPPPAPPACPYVYSFDLTMGAPMPLPPEMISPVPPSDCAFLKSLEEPLKRVAVVAGLAPEDGAMNFDVGFDDDLFNAFYMPGQGLIVTDGFLSCVRGRPDEAIQVLCHELGHAVQAKGSDEDAKQALEAIHDRNRTAAERRSLRRDIERHADLIGREICARAGAALDFAAKERATVRCAGWQSGEGVLSDHPGTAERLRDSKADVARLGVVRGHEVGAAIQRRSRRLMAGLGEDEPVNLDQTPRQWALTPQADKYRLVKPYVPSKSFAQVRTENNGR